eukprot:255285-Lingulodinium_polyedra.AAC.1
MLEDQWGVEAGDLQIAFGKNYYKDLRETYGSGSASALKTVKAKDPNDIVNGRLMKAMMATKKVP